MLYKKKFINYSKGWIYFMLISIWMHSLISILPYIIFFKWHLLLFDGILLMIEISYRDLWLVLFPKAVLSWEARK